MNFRMIQAVIKCFEKSTVQRIEDKLERRVPLFIDTVMQINTHKYGHGEMRNKNLINRGNNITQGLAVRQS